MHVQCSDTEREVFAWSRTLKTLEDVVAWDLCAGCGACHYACPKQAVTLVNIEAVGIRPTITSTACGTCRQCLSFCPGYQVNGALVAEPGWQEASHANEIGPYLEIWEGFAKDPEIRFNGSSGGVLSALALYCLERENMAFASHIAMDKERPWTNRTVQSRNRTDLISRSGSRYAPSSPCDMLQAIEDSDRPCVFIGKPCDTEAVGLLREQRSALNEKLGLVLTFFCAGTPSTRGTLDLIKSFNLAPDTVNSVRYRGEGWPGDFKVQHSDPTRESSLSYTESWGKLAAYRPLRCHLCPDGLGRVADISCGDAWHSKQDDDTGRSILIVRTRRGQAILRRAVAEGYVEIQPSHPKAVLAAQPSMMRRDNELFGRLFARRLLLAPCPTFHEFSLFRKWLRLPLLHKIGTLAGTIRRIVLRGQWHSRRRNGYY